MDKEAIKEYLIEFQKRELPQLVERELKIPETNKIITIIGPRRAGKTFFLFQLIKHLISNGIKKEHIIYLNFEDPLLIGIKYNEIKEMIKLSWELFPTKEKNFYVFVDEPQNIDKWETGIRGLYDEGFKIFLSGSSSKLLSKEIATSLRGRALSYLLLPLSFKEFLKIKKFETNLNKLSSKEKAELKNLFSEFLEFGGFPEVALEEEKETKIKILNSYFELIIYKDIIERHKIRNPFLIKWLIKILVSSFSNEMSINNIYQTTKSQGIKLSKNTLYNYVSFLEDSFFIFRLFKFSYSERKKDLISNKVYINDVAFSKLVESSRERGKKLENIVFLSLLRKKHELEDIHYWKNTQQEEVDFVLTQSKKVHKLIQVCSNPENINTKKREVRALLKASKELKCKDIFVITEDYDKEEEFEFFGIKRKVKFVPFFQFFD